MENCAGDILFELKETEKISMSESEIATVSKECIPAWTIFCC